MSKQIKNIHTEMVRLFVRREGVDKQVDIPPGHSMVVEDYMTPTMRVFEKKKFITITEAQWMQQDSFAWLPEDGSHADTIDEFKTMDESVDPNNDETMDHFHTTETHSAVVTEKEGGDVKIEVDGISTSVPNSLLKDMNKYHGMNKDSVISDVIKVLEGEVEQYIEGGFVKGEWTDEEIEFLKKNYPTKGRKYCSTHLNRNESSVQKKINSLGIKKRKKRKK